MRISDYGAPLSESGDYTEKYQLAKDLIAADNPVKTKIPEQPAITPKTAYPTVEMTEILTYTQLIDQVVILFNKISTNKHNFIPIYTILIADM